VALSGRDQQPGRQEYRKNSPIGHAIPDRDGLSGQRAGAEKLLEHAVITSDNGILQLPETSNPASLPETNASNAFSPISLDDAQRQHITHVLDHTVDRIEGPGGAAEILGTQAQHVAPSD
jgi:hypothetical protein